MKIILHDKRKFGKEAFLFQNGSSILKKYIGSSSQLKGEEHLET